MNLEQTHQFMIQGLEEQIFTGAVLLVSHEKQEVFSKAYGKLGDNETPSVTERTLFDLASLTKILATTPVWIMLASCRPEILDQPISEWFPAAPSDKGKITPRDLLAHISGLPAWRPYYLSRDHKSMMQLAKNEVLSEPLDYQTGTASVYSDLGFILLAAIAELENGQTFNSFCRKQIYEPLGISNDLMFNPVGQEHRTAWTRQGEPPGMVNDLNARALGGVSGHAGLFGTAHAALLVANEIVAGIEGKSVLFNQEITRIFCQKVDHVQGCSRALGFDTPSPEGSSSGRFFSRSSLGHTGYTGTSLWIDLARELIVVLLTNRVFMGESNLLIKAFRPKVHDSIMEEILRPDGAGKPFSN